MKLIRQYLELVRFSHTLFALPFALAAFFAALRQRGEGMDWALLGWVLVCMVSARTAAMAFNRLVDREIDRRNPRTANRHLPRGLVSVGEVAVLVFVCCAVFVFACWMINTLTLLLSPIALAVVLGYSWTKRFTSFSHFVLGLALALAPLGAWIAVEGALGWAPVALGLGVLVWVAGFDILYALQDEAFDRKEGLYSVVVRLGRARAMQLSSLLHLLAAGGFAGFGVLAGFGTIYFVGVAVVSAVLLYEHRIVSPQDISRINAAFFTANGIASLVLLVFTLLELYPPL